MLFVNHMTAYELLISDWISDVFSSDLVRITQAAVVFDVDVAVAFERLDQQPDLRLVVLRGLDRVLHHLLAVFNVVDRDDGHAGADAGVERRTDPAHFADAAGLVEVDAERINEAGAAASVLRLRDRKSTRLNSSH